MRKTGIRSRQENRLFYTLLGHCLQHGALPYENELSMWMRGAAAVVDGEKIYLRDVHNWCQKRSDVRKRRIMEKETSSLAKFLRPFALSSWEYVLDLIENELEYVDYVDYCREKKGLDYSAHLSKTLDFLGTTDELYFGAMEDWVNGSLGISLSEASHFDAIYLVGLGEFDSLFPNHIPIAEHLRFFDHWQMDVAHLPGLHLHTSFSRKKGSQGITFALKIPQEVHVVLNPQGGWIDLETLFHEMGHALSLIFTSPALSPTEKDFNTSSTLSETFAFLVQNMCFSPSFLERQLGLKPKEIDTISHYKALKDMAFFRRYAAKFLAEYKMYEEKTIGNGETYASILKKHTGFTYKPETQLFDLAPELYSLDYVMAWMGEVSMERSLARNLGEEWMFKPEAGQILREWWRSGNRDEFEESLSREGIGPLNSSDILDRWKKKIKQ
ncbi:MAG: hypothetical protein EHM36_13400 [Deltaproteobacteria bacterium]|nr:MAG: hypothetical protein EHM36_13400 [Deltaproteobacteria bacterium]